MSHVHLRPGRLCSEPGGLQSRLYPGALRSSVHLPCRVPAPQRLQDLCRRRRVPDPRLLQPAVLQRERLLQVLLLRGLPAGAQRTHLQGHRWDEDTGCCNGMCTNHHNYYQQITLSPITGHSSGLFRLSHFAFINNVIHLNIALTLSIKWISFHFVLIILFLR